MIVVRVCVCYTAYPLNRKLLRYVAGKMFKHSERFYSDLKVSIPVLRTNMGASLDFGKVLNCLQAGLMVLPGS